MILFLRECVVHFERKTLQELVYYITLWATLSVADTKFTDFSALEIF